MGADSPSAIVRLWANQKYSTTHSSPQRAGPLFGKEFVLRRLHRRWPPNARNPASGTVKRLAPVVGIPRPRHQRAHNRALGKGIPLPIPWMTAELHDTKQFADRLALGALWRREAPRFLTRLPQLPRLGFRAPDHLIVIKQSAESSSFLPSSKPIYPRKPLSHFLRRNLVGVVA